MRVAPSPLKGEGDFQRERKPANVRKAGEGECNKRTPFHPLPIFLILVPHIEKSPPPSRGRGR